MEKRIKLLEALKIRLGSYVITEDKAEGIKSIPKYIFMCPIHGVVETTQRKNDEHIECPHCKTIELRKNSLFLDISKQVSGER